MSLIEKITADLKAAMLARDEFTTMTLRGLKSAILYEEVEKGKRDEGLTDEEIQVVVAREVKKRDDAAKLYVSAGEQDRADKEVKENEILAVYLPTQLSSDELRTVIGNIIVENNFEQKDMGKIIAATKAKVGLAASGEKIVTTLKQEFFN